MSRSRPATSAIDRCSARWTNLREVRQEHGLSQERLAEMTGVSTNFVGEMERGLKALGLGVIVRLSLALGVSVHDLLRDFTDARVRRLRL
jgi:transcriptional regulator with XRE-family HTH domain